MATKTKTRASGDIHNSALMIKILAIHEMDSKDKLLESLILAQDERWRRA